MLQKGFQGLGQWKHTKPMRLSYISWGHQLWDQRMKVIVLRCSCWPPSSSPLVVVVMVAGVAQEQHPGSVTGVLGP